MSTVTATEAGEVRALLTGVYFTERDVCAALGIASLDEMPASRLHEVRTALEGLPVSAPPAPSAVLPSESLPAVTLEALLSRAPERVEYVWYGYLASGSVTELDAKAKAGKTTFVLHAVRAVLAGESFLEHATAACPVLYLTEESRPSFTAALQRAGIPAGAALHVLLRGAARRHTWEQLGELVLAYVREHSIGLVVVDTLSDWAGLRGDEENSAGAALAVVQPMRAWADAGCAVLALRHERKGTAEIGESARGSSAFGGAVDIILRLARTRGRGHEARRVLEAVGRFDETPAALTLELTAGRFVKVADGAAAAHREAELEVLEALAELQEACTEAALCEHIGKGHSTIGRALKDLCTRGVIESEKRPREDGHGVVTVYRHGGVL